VPGAAGLTGVTAIAAGRDHSLALKRDGTVVAWGCQAWLDYAQCTVPPGLRHVTAIAAGAFQSLALRSNSKVVAWGCDLDANAGQCNVPSRLVGVTAIATGGVQSLALTTPRCVVPRVVGMQLRAAKRKLARVRCRAGTIRRVLARHASGTVLFQARQPGSILRDGARVGLIAGR